MPNVIPSTEQLIGQIIDGGRLCLIDPLGHGSGGVVFRALDLCSSSPYAVKCMVKAEVDSRQASFQMREIRLHTAVSSHPNVVTLHRVVEEDGYIFLVLDYCAGGDLFKYLTQRGTFVRNDALVKGAMCQLIDALEACHKRGVFHRDIKPENIMCSRDGTQLKLGDFGLATDSLRSRNFGAGTSGYMSPECIGTDMGQAGYYTAANDVWSLGVILTSMISGHNPWRRAVMTDDCFKSYIHNPNFFRHMLPISAAANNILVDIFAPSEIRLTLSALRKRILNADTFFLTDEQIAISSRFVQLAAASYLADNSAPESTGSSFDVLLGSDPAIATQKEGVIARAQRVHGVGAKPELEDTIAMQVVIERPQLNGTRPGLRKRPVPPPPQPMPSVRDLCSLSSGSSNSDEESKRSSKGRRTQSPVRFLKRIMDRIFLD